MSQTDPPIYDATADLHDLRLRAASRRSAGGWVAIVLMESKFKHVQVLHCLGVFEIHVVLAVESFSSCCIWGNSLRECSASNIELSRAAGPSALGGARRIAPEAGIHDGRPHATPKHAEQALIGLLVCMKATEVHGGHQPTAPCTTCCTD